MYMKSEDSNFSQNKNTRPQFSPELISLLKKSKELWDESMEYYNNTVQNSKGLGSFSAWVDHAGNMLKVISIQSDLIRLLVTELKKYEDM